MESRHTRLASASRSVERLGSNGPSSSCDLLDSGEIYDVKVPNMLGRQTSIHPNHVPEARPAILHPRRRYLPPRESRCSNVNNPTESKKVNSVSQREPSSRLHIFDMAPPRSASKWGRALTVHAQLSLLKLPRSYVNVPLWGALVMAYVISNPVLLLLRTKA